MMMAVKIMTSKRVFRSGGRGCRSRRHRTRGRVLLAKYRRRRRHARLLRVSVRARVRKRRVYFMRAFGGIDYSSILSSFWLLLLPLYNLLLRYATTKYLPLFRVGRGVLLKTTRLSLSLSLSLFFRYSTNHAPLPTSRPYFLVPLKRLFTLPARLFPGAQTFLPDARAFARMRGDERALEDV